ncbi:MAG: lysophospholipid acyltransferase family protein [Planctomycetales bacterium]|nr:lysophospholipid acyltransferase family protein [Planctomycetales bacterium]MCA9209267.1 lysophospholipid acyltransferase family protein [Planctomycetales bacterium]
MKIKSPLLLKTAGLGIASLTANWMSTLQYKGFLYDPDVDPASPQCQGPMIYLFWHEYIPFLFYLRSHCRLSMLVSQHADAEFLSQAARHMGFGTVRGSTTRGGVTALRQMLQSLGDRNLAITPDGPRGPRRKLAQGCVYLSSKLQMPLVAIGLGYDRPWRYRRAWDQFAVPRPFSRARGIASPAMHIPSDLDRDGIEHYRQQVERLLNFLTDEAEQWAESGARREGEVSLRRQPAARRAAALDASREAPELAADPDILPFRRIG